MTEHHFPYFRSRTIGNVGFILGRGGEFGDPTILERSPLILRRLGIPPLNRQEKKILKLNLSKMLTIL